MCSRALAIIGAICQALVLLLNVALCLLRRNSHRFSTIYASLIIDKLVISHPGFRNSRLVIILSYEIHNFEPRVLNS